MTYFGVLAGYVIPPTLILMLLVPRDIWHHLFKGQVRVYWAPYLAVLLHILLALVYTTPWDNYLVATNVWWYDPDLVTGITIGWVPIEEYTFFVVQTLLTGLWTLALIRFALNSRPSGGLRRGFRRQATVVVIAVWLISTAFLLVGPVIYGWWTPWLSRAVPGPSIQARPPESNWARSLWRKWFFS